MNNYEKIKSMSVDEMAEFSSVFQRCSFCALAKRNSLCETLVNFEDCRKTTCKDGIKQWLLAETTEEN